QLVTAMSQRPEAILVLAASSDTRGLMGFVIADLGLGKIVNLRQAWVSPKADWTLARALQNRLMLWTVSHNRDQIEVRTQRSAEAMYRRFGFEKIATILMQTIPEEFTQRLLDSVMIEEVPNG